jgi:DNA transposition AAA+ family ATPase
MREAANYIENRAHNLSVKPDKITKTALKEALKDASQEQIERAYTILSGLDDAYETAKEESVEDVEIDDEDFLPPPEWDEE